MKLTTSLLALLSMLAIGVQGQGRFSVVEASIPSMQAAMAKGQVTSRQLVEQYLIRIALYGRLHAP